MSFSIHPHIRDGGPSKARLLLGHLLGLLLFHPILADVFLCTIQCVAYSYWKGFHLLWLIVGIHCRNSFFCFYHSFISAWKSLKIILSLPRDSFLDCFIIIYNNISYLFNESKCCICILLLHIIQTIAGQHWLTLDVCQIWAVGYLSSQGEVHLKGEEKLRRAIEEEVWRETLLDHFLSSVSDHWYLTCCSKWFVWVLHLLKIS